MNTQKLKSENILKVIENFKKVLPIAKYKNHLNMREEKVNGSDHACGTVHCHGGWYAVATCDLSQFVGFSFGADNMAKDLGFNVKNDIKDYFGNNEKLWGNKNAVGIFCDQTAFYHPEKRPKGAQNLQHIIDHWTEVHERVKVLEEKLSIETEVQECDATKMIKEQDAGQQKVIHVYHSVEVSKEIREMERVLN